MASHSQRVSVQRQGWRERLEYGGTLHIPVLDDYRENRNLDTWRVSSQMEKLCEYVMFLESEIDNLEDNC